MDLEAMTLNPDREPEKPNEYASTPLENEPGCEWKTNDLFPAGRGDDATGDHDDESSHEDGIIADVISLRDQLAAAGFDLTGHPLADEFGARDAVDVSEPALPDGPEIDYFSTVGDPSGVDDSRSAADCSGAEDFARVEDRSGVGDVDPVEYASRSEQADRTEIADRPVDDGDQSGTISAGQRPDMDEPRYAAAQQAGEQRSAASGMRRWTGAADDESPAWVTRHPLLTDEAWADLTAFAPEVTGSISTLMEFDSELRSFDRPMGPSEALLLVDGAEALSRIGEALSTLALSVYERVGTPTETGAKNTKALIQNRLNLTPSEAHRRTELAKNLGGRVDTTGQALEPLCPEVAEGLHTGKLSAGQAKAIDDCMNDLPDWVTAEQRADVEKQLVDYAPTVRVKDLRGIFDHMLAYIDPDGEEPREETPRTDYSITIRPKKNGDWVLGGLLDPVSGATLNGLLTSRIRSASTDGETIAPSSAPEPTSGEIGSTSGESSADHLAVSGQQSLFDVADSVLRGDVFDAPLPAMPAPPDWALQATPDAVDGVDDRSASDGGKHAAGEFPVGVGLREDGNPVDLTAERPSAKAWIYERFVTLLGRISMEQAGTGSPYALVVTAKAEDLANGTGKGTTGAEAPIPIHELIANGLNGSVFFHLMSEKARTVQVLTEKRFANKHQVAVITARDKGCTFPGCDAPPGWCEVNHVVPWARGGKTEINNLALACSAHHHLLDRSDWEMRMLIDGRPAWIPPATVDPARRPILHPRFITEEIIESLFDDRTDED